MVEFNADYSGSTFLFNEWLDSVLGPANNGGMRSLFFILFLSSFQCFAQYEDYKSYDTFSELDKWQRDYGLVFIPSLFYNQIDENNDVSGAVVGDRTRNLTFYDVQLGYIFRNGFYFGVLYTGETQDINEGNPTTSRASLGASFGYIRHGWAFKGTFFPYSKQTLENLTVSDYTEGWGYQLDAAYYFRLGRFVSIGPQLVYKSFEYGKAEAAATNVTSDASSKHNVFTPMISFLFNIYRG